MSKKKYVGDLVLKGVSTILIMGIELLHIKYLIFQQLKLFLMWLCFYVIGCINFTSSILIFVTSTDILAFNIIMDEFFILMEYLGTNIFTLYIDTKVLYYSVYIYYIRGNVMNHYYEIKKREKLMDFKFDIKLSTCHIKIC